MSYDLMVFEPSVAPRERQKFMEWYQQQTQWSESHSLQRPHVTSPALQSWFQEMIQSFPAMNGPFAVDDFDNPKVTDHCIGRDVIYSAFAWSCAEEARAKMRSLAVKHRFGFFDLSSSEGEILFPGDPDTEQVAAKKPWWRIW